jgi:hypothetical protein
LGDTINPEFITQDASWRSALTPVPSPKKWERGMIADLMILHCKSGAKSLNRHFLPFFRFGGRGQGMGVDHVSQFRKFITGIHKEPKKHKLHFML